MDRVRILTARGGAQGVYADSVPRPTTSCARNPSHRVCDNRRLWYCWTSILARRSPSETRMSPPRFPKGHVMKRFLTLPKLRAGDQVAVLSPSAGLPGRYPHIQELGLRRLRTLFGLVPVEYPTTRQMGASPEDRARDLMAAFADPANRAVFASVGGDDQIRVLAHLDEELFLRNPKPFFGFSDNTHFQTFLWRLGIPSYYGGSIMTQLAMPQAMHEMTVRYLRRALFEAGSVELEASREFTDVSLDWADPESLKQARPMEPNEGWSWDGEGVVDGTLWGGCLESLAERLEVDAWLPSPNDLATAVLFLESSELVPDADFVRRVLTRMGQQGLLAAVGALLVGRPKAWNFSQPNPPEWRKNYRREQRAAMLETFRLFNPSAPVVQNLDFGHTDPQVPLPNGGRVQLDARRRRIILTY